MSVERLSKTYFSDDELRCKCGCNGLQLNPTFDKKLLELRESFGKPMRVNSCCRCDKHNKAVGGNPRSFHVYDKPARPTGGTCAIDIARKDKVYNDSLVLTAWKAGWSVGVNPTFIHLDVRTDVVKLPQTVFPYGSTSPTDLKHFKDLVKEAKNGR